MEISNRWKYRIAIKSILSDESTTSPEKAIQLSEWVKRELVKIKNSVENNTRIDEYDKFSFTDELEMIIDNYDFLISLADGTIKKEDWDDCSFDGNYQNLFNEYLTMVYDLGDKRIISESPDGQQVSEKFMWVN